MSTENRLFIPAELLSRWVRAGGVDLEGGELRIKSDGTCYKLLARYLIEKLE